MANPIYLVVAETSEEEPETTDVMRGSRTAKDIGNPFDEDTEAVKVGKKSLKRVPVDAQLLKSQMSGMIATLEELFAEAEQKQGMQLTKVELSVTINGKGEVSILGTGASLANTGAVTMTFARNP